MQGESSDEAQDRERPIGEELGAGLNDVRESENVSQEEVAAESPREVKEERSENQGSSADHDPLLESVVSFQAAQQALPREIQKFKEIGKDVIFGHSFEDVGIPSDDSNFPRPSTSVLSQHRGVFQHSIDSLESKLVSLKQNILLFQNKVQKAADLVKSKKARVTKLELGKDVIFGHSFEDVGITSDDSDFPKPSTSVLSQHRGVFQHSIDSLDSKMVSLKQNALLLQNKVQKVADLVKSKKARVTKLEAIPSSSSKSEAETIESEIEVLFRQKIEAEVQYLTISSAAQKLRSAVADQHTLLVLEEQKTLASEQAQMVHMPGDAEAKAAMLKTQDEKLESYCEDLASSPDEKLKLQKKVCKYSSCLFIQLVLLAVVIGQVLMQMSPDHDELVPT